MKLLSEAASRLMARLADVENEAGQLLSEVDALDTRLHRAFTAVSIDNWVAYLNVERNRMLKAEKQAENTASLTRFPALGIYGLVSLSSGQRPDWRRAASSIFAEEPFADIRVAVGLDDTKLLNVSRIARSRGMTVSRVVASLQDEGYEVLRWPEFVARAYNLRRAVLRGEPDHLGIEEAALQTIQSLAHD